MRIRARLNHIGAAIADSFINRNNDLDGYWAPGLLYQPGTDNQCRITLNLLTEVAEPPNHYCERVTRNYAAFMRRALPMQGLYLDELTAASIHVQFNAVRPKGGPTIYLQGDPFIVTVMLRARDREVSVERWSRCLGRPESQFSRRGV